MNLIGNGKLFSNISKIVALPKPRFFVGPVPKESSVGHSKGTMSSY